MKEKRLEVLLWSIAFPGFGQILTGRFFKGISFIILEIILNLNSSFNTAIIHSFNGNISEAIEVTDYQWLMFYPCVYMFAIWDAYRESGGGKTPAYSYLPFASTAYFVTVGLIYSATLEIFGVRLGPVWLPILFLIPGLSIGFLVRKIIIRFS